MKNFLCVGFLTKLVLYSIEENPCRPELHNEIDLSFLKLREKYECPMFSTIKLSERILLIYNSVIHIFGVFNSSDVKIKLVNQGNLNFADKH
jgi:hypothetical protein